MVRFAPEVQVPVFLTIKGSEIIETGEIRDLNISEEMMAVWWRL